MQYNVPYRKTRHTSVHIFNDSIREALQLKFRQLPLLTAYAAFGLNMQTRFPLILIKRKIQKTDSESASQVPDQMLQDVCCRASFLPY